MALVLVSSAAVSSACGGSASGGLDRVPEGEWGGQGVAITVGPTGSDLQFDCAHGAITVPLNLEPDATFRAPGYFVQEHGGPAREDEQEDRRPATYSGSSDGRQIRFSIALTEEGQTLGPFAATFGAPADLFRCLTLLDPGTTSGAP